MGERLYDTNPALYLEIGSPLHVVRAQTRSMLDKEIQIGKCHYIDPLQPRECHQHPQAASLITFFSSFRRKSKGKGSPSLFID